MNFHSVQNFIEVVESALHKAGLSFRLQIILHSPQSFKANYHLENNIFLAVRYNARNGRMDFALIQNQQRIFGYDNLKNWHYHPSENPNEHVFCSEPTIEQIVTEVKAVCAKVKSSD